MNTPILTKNKQRHSLSAKKGPVRGLRNILAQPCEDYWPTINPDEYPALITLMNKLLLLIKRPKFRIPGSMLRHMSKEKRILARKEALEKETDKPDEDNLKSVILGINAVTRALEKDDICCVLLDANVEPRLLIKHIVVMAQNKKVPVLLLPVLKTVTLQTIGFATATIALMRNVMQSSDNPFNALYNLIVEISRDFEPPKSLLQLFKTDQAPEDNGLSETEILNTNRDLDSNVSMSKKSVILTDVYKYRTSRTERAFIPPFINKDHQTLQTMSIESNKFLFVDSDPTDKNSENNLQIRNYTQVNIHKEEKTKSDNVQKHNIKPSFNESESINVNLSNDKRNNATTKRKNTDVTYFPLKVKRIQGNNNRKKATKVAKKEKKNVLLLSHHTK